MRQARLGTPDAPHDQRGERNSHHRRNEIARGDIGQALDRRARTLRLAHHVHDPREQRVGADALGAHQQAPRAIHRGADQPRARSFFHRDGFAGHHGFIQRAGSFQHDAIHRHLLAGTHAQHIASLHALQRNIFFATVGTHDARIFWCETEQQFDRGASLAARAQFHYLA